jgi:predicted GIY-YIG superfamily endonuclease
MWSVYLLHQIEGNQTYIGATVDPDRRLQQHNGAKSGGARATKGKSWERRVLVQGFPTQVAALQFEWAWKFQSRKGPRGFQGRMEALWRLLDLPQSTSKAEPYTTWPETPTVLLALRD